jgi:hypothetical protein
MSAFEDFELGETALDEMEILLEAIRFEVARRQSAGESMEFLDPDDSGEWMTPEIWGAAEARLKESTNE